MRLFWANFNLHFDIVNAVPTIWGGPYQYIYMYICIYFILHDIINFELMHTSAFPTKDACMILGE